MTSDSDHHSQPGSSAETGLIIEINASENSAPPQPTILSPLGTPASLHLPIKRLADRGTDEIFYIYMSILSVYLYVVYTCMVL